MKPSRKKKCRIKKQSEIFTIKGKKKHKGRAKREMCQFHWILTETDRGEGGG